MPLPAKIASLFRSLFHKARLDSELDAELHSYLDMLTEEKIKAGMSPEQARRQARIELGGMEQVKMKVREVRFGTTLETVWQDLRYGLRMLRKNPGFTTVAVLTLALGIGANTAIFSMVHAALLEPLPYPDPENVVMIWEHNRRRNSPQNLISPANFFDWKERNTAFQSLSAFHYRNWTLTGNSVPERVSGVRVVGDFFQLLRVQPYIGQTFSPKDIAQDERKIVLSYEFWQRRFGGDPSLVGKSLTLDGNPMTVTGVLPPRTGLPPGTDIWLPSVFTESDRRARGRYLIGVGRLKPGLSLTQARAEMDTIARQLEEEHPRFNTDFGVTLMPLREAFSGSVRGRLLLLLGAVGFVLLIACANVANLLLSRVAARERELAIRQALGAARLRLVRQLLTESLLLAALGGLGGVALAYQAIGVLSAILPGGIRATMQVGLSVSVLGFTLLISLLAGVLFGVAPSFQPSRVHLQQSLKEGGRGATSGRQRLRNLLVVTEVALSLILLIGAGLLVRGLINLQRVDPGFDPENVLTFRTTLPNSTAGEASERAAGQAAFYRQALERIEALPGVESVGAVNFLPIETGAAGTMFVLPDRPAPPPGQEPVADIVAVAGNYFRTMGIPLLRGRFFNQQDSADAPRVVIINQTTARQFWPDDDPLGKRVIMFWDRGVEGEIVGVVGDVLQRSLSGKSRAMLYWAEPQFTYGFMSIVIRTKLEPSGLTAPLRSEIAALDPDLPAYGFQTMNQVLSDSVARSRVTIQLLSLFSGLALVLAVVGLYGVIAYSVSQRTHEIGIRIALGAQRGDILRMIMGQGLGLVLVGVGVGLAGAFALTRFLESLLFGVTPTDPATFAAVAAVLAAVALLACYLPARRATKVDPMVALRYE